jgi:hypothetical protein
LLARRSSARYHSFFDGLVGAWRSLWELQEEMTLLRMEVWREEIQR